MRVSAGPVLLKNLGRAMQNGHVGLQNRVPGCFLAVQVDFEAVQNDFWPSRANVRPSRSIFWLSDWFSYTPDRLSGAHEARTPSFSLDRSMIFTISIPTAINIQRSPSSYDTESLLDQAGALEKLADQARGATAPTQLSD